MADKKEREQLIEGSELFQALASDDRLQLLESGELVSFKDGELILEEGQSGETFYLIESGEVEVSTVNDGEKVSLATLSQGDVIGEVALFSDQPRTATVTALSEVQTLKFKNEKLKKLLDEHPELQKALQSMILDRAQATIEKIVGA